MLIQNAYQKLENINSKCFIYFINMLTVRIHIDIYVIPYEAFVGIGLSIGLRR